MFNANHCTDRDPPSPADPAPAWPDWMAVANHAAQAQRVRLSMRQQALVARMLSGLAERLGCAAGAATEMRHG